MEWKIERFSVHFCVSCSDRNCHGSCDLIDPFIIIFLTNTAYYKKYTINCKLDNVSEARLLIPSKDIFKN